MSLVTHLPWSEPDAPTEDLLAARMAGENLQPRRWSKASGDRDPVQSCEYGRVIYCIEGSMWVTITDEHDRTIELEAGDRIDIPAGIRHGVMAGIDGVTCLEGRSQ